MPTSITHSHPNAFHVWDQDDVIIPMTPRDESPLASPLMAVIPYIPSFFPTSLNMGSPSYNQPCLPRDIDAWGCVFARVSASEHGHYFHLKHLSSTLSFTSHPSQAVPFSFLFFFWLLRFASLVDLLSLCILPSKQFLAKIIFLKETEKWICFRGSSHEYCGSYLYVFDIYLHAFQWRHTRPSLNGWIYFCLSNWPAGDQIYGGMFLHKFTVFFFFLRTILVERDKDTVGQSVGWPLIADLPLDLCQVWINIILPLTRLTCHTRQFDLIWKPSDVVEYFA